MFEPVIWYLEPFGAPGLSRHNYPQAATLDLELRVWDREWLAEKRHSRQVVPRDLLTLIPGRKLETYTSPCPYGTSRVYDSVAECARAETLKRTSNVTKSNLQMIEFRVDLGRLGQDLDSPPSVGVWLSVKGWSRGIDLTDLVADPEIADLGAVEDDTGRPGEVDLKWHERAPRDALGTYPDFPDPEADPTYAELTPETSVFAPPRIAPWQAPTKRLVQVWRYLTTHDERYAVVASRLVEHLLISGGAGVALYVTPGIERPFLADPTIRKFIATGRFAVVLWKPFAQCAGWEVYEQIFFNAHASLSHWGRNVLVFATDINEVIALSDLPPTQELARRLRDIPKETQEMLDQRKVHFERSQQHGKEERRAKDIAAKAARDKIVEERLARERVQARADRKSKQAVARAAAKNKTGKALLAILEDDQPVQLLLDLQAPPVVVTLNDDFVTANATTHDKGPFDSSAATYDKGRFDEELLDLSNGAQAALRRMPLAEASFKGNGISVLSGSKKETSSEGGSAKGGATYSMSEADYGTAKGAAMLSRAETLVRERPSDGDAGDASAEGAGGSGRRGWNAHLPSVLAGLLVSNPFVSSLEGTPGVYSLSGRSSMFFAKQRGNPPPSPGDALPPPTPRQARASSVLAYDGCMHRWSKDLVLARYQDEAHASSLRTPGCAQVNGLAVTSKGWAPDSSRRKTDLELFIGTTSAADVMDKFTLSQTSSRWTKPLVDPDAVLGVDPHSASECFGGRTEPWGRPPPGGIGAQLPIQRRADGFWNLEELGVPQSLSTKGTDPPPVRSRCRFIRTCPYVPEECLQFRHIINLEQPRKGVPYTYRNDGWLWVYHNKDWKSAYPTQEAVPNN